MDPSRTHVVSLSRAEAERMRTAITGAEDGATVDMPVRQFAQLAELITLLCDLVSADAGEDAAEVQPADPDMMEGPKDKPAMAGPRSLAQIEREMGAAAADFADAEKRFRLADRDRTAALETINRLQLEIDTIIAEWRHRSPAESNWKRGDPGADNLLIRDGVEPSEAERALLRNSVASTWP